MVKMLKVTLVKSLIGSSPKQRATAKALGLSRLQHSRLHHDTPDIRGKIRQLEHLLAVEEVEAERDFSGRR